MRRPGRVDGRQRRGGRIGSAGREVDLGEQRRLHGGASYGRQDLEPELGLALRRLEIAREQLERHTDLGQSPEREAEPELLEQELCALVGGARLDGPAGHRLQPGDAAEHVRLQGR